MGRDVPPLPVVGDHGDGLAVVFGERPEQSRALMREADPLAGAKAHHLHLRLHRHQVQGRPLPGPAIRSRADVVGGVPVLFQGLAQKHGKRHRGRIKPLAVLGQMRLRDLEQLGADQHVPEHRPCNWLKCLPRRASAATG